MKKVGRDVFHNNYDEKRFCEVIKGEYELPQP